MPTFKRFRPFAAFGLGLVYFLANCVFVHSAESNFWSARRSSRREPARVAGLPGASRSPNYADVLTGLPPPEPGASSVLSGELKNNLPSGFLKHADNALDALSPQYGSLRSATVPPNVENPPVVIHIQDVHLNAEAQANIGKTMQALVDRGAVDLVALEGAFGEIDLERFRAFPHKDSTRAAADFLLREQKISGPIHAALVSEKEIPPLVGVDDRGLYQANADAYRRAAGRMEKDKSDWRSRADGLAARKRRVFNPELLAFDDAMERFHSGNENLGDHVRRLTSLPAPGPFPETEKFSRALEIERSLDFDEVERQRAALVRDLTGRLDRDQIDALTRLSAAYHLGSVRYAEFYGHLKDLCERTGSPLSDYPSMEKYVRYVLLADGIDAARLLSEISSLEKARYGALATTESEENLLKESRRSRLTGKLLAFALTPEEWKEYQVASGQLPVAGVNPPATGHQPPVTLNLSSYESFYREARSRDEAMARNLRDAMDVRGARTAVLVTGGFHGDGVSSRLRAGGAAVLTYAPKISRADGGTSYLSVFNREKTPLEKMFAGEKLFLSPENWTPEIRMGQAAAMMAKESFRPDGFAPQDVLTDLFGALSGVGAWIEKKAREATVFIRRADETVAVTFVLSADGRIESMAQEEPLSPPWRRIARAAVVFSATLAAMVVLESLVPTHGAAPAMFSAIVFLGDGSLLPKSIVPYQPPASSLAVEAKAVVPLGVTEEPVSPELLSIDLYAALELEEHRDAGRDEIKIAFRRLARKYHPDVNIGDAHAEQKFRDINQAYSVLNDPAKRAYYDRRSRFGQHGRWRPATPLFPARTPAPQLGSGKSPEDTAFRARVGRLLMRISSMRETAEADLINGKPNPVHRYLTPKGFAHLMSELSSSEQGLKTIWETVEQNGLASMDPLERRKIEMFLERLEEAPVRWDALDEREFFNIQKEFLKRWVDDFNVPREHRVLFKRFLELKKEIEEQLELYFIRVKFDAQGFWQHLTIVRKRVAELFADLKRTPDLDPGVWDFSNLTLGSTYATSEKSRASQWFFHRVGTVYRRLAGRELTPKRWAELGVAWLWELPQSIPAMLLNQRKTGSYLMRHAAPDETIDSAVMQERLRGIRWMRLVSFTVPLLVEILIYFMFRLNAVPFDQAAAVILSTALFAFVSSNALSHLAYNIRHPGAPLTTGEADEDLLSRLADAVAGGDAAGLREAVRPWVEPAAAHLAQVQRKIAVVGPEPFALLAGINLGWLARRDKTTAVTLLELFREEGDFRALADVSTYAFLPGYLLGQIAEGQIPGPGSLELLMTSDLAPEEKGALAETVLRWALVNLDYERTAEVFKQFYSEARALMTPALLSAVLRDHPSVLVRLSLTGEKFTKPAAELLEEIIDGALKDPHGETVAPALACRRELLALFGSDIDDLRNKARRRVEAIPPAFWLVAADDREYAHALHRALGSQQWAEAWLRRERWFPAALVALFASFPDNPQYLERLRKRAPNAIATDDLIEALVQVIYGGRAAAEFDFLPGDGEALDLLIAAARPLVHGRLIVSIAGGQAMGGVAPADFLRRLLEEDRESLARPGPIAGKGLFIWTMAERFAGNAKLQRQIAKLLEEMERSAASLASRDRSNAADVPVRALLAYLSESRPPLDRRDPYTYYLTPDEATAAALGSFIKGFYGDKKLLPAMDRVIDEEIAAFEPWGDHFARLFFLDRLYPTAGARRSRLQEVLYTVEMIDAIEGSVIPYLTARYAETHKNPARREIDKLVQDWLSLNRLPVVHRAVGLVSARFAFFRSLETGAADAALARDRLEKALRAYPLTRSSDDILRELKTPRAIRAGLGISEAEATFFDDVQKNVRLRQSSWRMVGPFPDSHPIVLPPLVGGVVLSIGALALGVAYVGASLIKDRIMALEWFERGRAWRRILHAIVAVALPDLSGVRKALFPRTGRAPSKRIFAEPPVVTVTDLELVPVRSGPRVLLVYDAASESQFREFGEAKRRLIEIGVDVVELTRETDGEGLRRITAGRISLLVMPENDAIHQYLSETLGDFLGPRPPFMMQLWENGIKADVIVDTVSHLVGASAALGSRSHVGRSPRILFIYDESIDMDRGRTVRTAGAWLEKRGFGIVSLSGENDAALLERPGLFDEPFDLIVTLPDEVSIERWESAMSMQTEGARQVDLSVALDDYWNILARLGEELSALLEAGRLEDSPELSAFLQDLASEERFGAARGRSLSDADLVTVPGPGILLVVSQKGGDRKLIEQMAAMLRGSEGYEVTVVEGVSSAGNAMIAHPGRYGAVVMDSQQTLVSADRFAAWINTYDPDAPRFAFIDTAGVRPGTPGADALVLQAAEAAFTAWSLRWTGMAPQNIDPPRPPRISLSKGRTDLLNVVAWPTFVLFVTAYTGSLAAGILTAAPFMILGSPVFRRFIVRIISGAVLKMERALSDLHRAQAMARILKGESAGADAINALLDLSEAGLDLSALDHNLMALSSSPSPANRLVFRAALKFNLRWAGNRLKYEQALSRLAGEALGLAGGRGVPQGSAFIYTTVVLGGSAQDVEAVLESAIAGMRDSAGNLRGELALFPEGEEQSAAAQDFIDARLSPDEWKKVHLLSRSEGQFRSSASGRAVFDAVEADRRLFRTEGAPWTEAASDPRTRWRLIAPQTYFEVWSDGLRGDSPLKTADIVRFGVEIFRQLRELAFLATQA